MSKKKEHCELGRMLTEEEVSRLHILLEQQGIYIERPELVAHIDKAGDREDCPLRVTVGEGTDFCIDRCYLSKELGGLAKKLSE